MKLTLRLKARVESLKPRWVFEVAPKVMNERSLGIHSYTLDRVADAHQTNVGGCRFVSSRCGIEKVKWRLGWLQEWEGYGDLVPGREMGKRAPELIN